MTGKIVRRCCICEHDLCNHIDEGTGWRCHALGQDAYQCECFLRKERGYISYYDLDLRIEKHADEFKEGKG
jgi:hypothetical protein